MDVVVFAKALYKVLREHEEALSESLASGGARDFEQYKQTVGEIRGLNFAVSNLKALLEKTADDVEDTLRS